jgi:hypothetical protein
MGDAGEENLRLKVLTCITLEKSHFLYDPERMVTGMNRWRKKQISWGKSTGIFLALWLGLAFPVTICAVESSQSMRKECRTSSACWEQSQRERGRPQLAVTGMWCVPGGFMPVNNEGTPHQSSPEMPSQRAGSALVGSIMALLATFEAANVLPPEGTSQANQLIHGLIQLQSAIVKSNSSELREYVSAAIESHYEGEGTSLAQSIHQNGLTSKVLEAILVYDRNMSMWDNPAIVHLLQSYNVSQSDWQLIGQIFAKADMAYRTKGLSIHEAYGQWRTQMPGDR